MYEVIKETAARSLCFVMCWCGKYPGLQTTSIKTYSISSQYEDDIDTAVKRVAKVISKESQDFKRDESTYDTTLCMEDVLACVSQTL